LSAGEIGQGGPTKGFLKVRYTIIVSTGTAIGQTVDATIARQQPLCKFYLERGI
jgi:hypothetical protein